MQQQPSLQSRLALASSWGGLLDDLTTAMRGDSALAYSGSDGTDAGVSFIMMCEDAAPLLSAGGTFIGDLSSPPQEQQQHQQLQPESYDGFGSEATPHQCPRSISTPPVTSMGAYDATVAPWLNSPCQSMPSNGVLGCVGSPPDQGRGNVASTPSQQPSSAASTAVSAPRLSRAHVSHHGGAATSWANPATASPPTPPSRVSVNRVSHTLGHLVLVCFLPVHTLGYDFLRNEPVVYVRNGGAVVQLRARVEPDVAPTFTLRVPSAELSGAFDLVAPLAMHNSTTGNVLTVLLQYVLQNGGPAPRMMADSAAACAATPVPLVVMQPTSQHSLSPRPLLHATVPPTTSLPALSPVPSSSSPCATSSPPFGTPSPAPGSPTPAEGPERSPQWKYGLIARVKDPRGESTLWDGSRMPWSYQGHVKVRLPSAAHGYEFLTLEQPAYYLCWPHQSRARPERRPERAQKAHQHGKAERLYACVTHSGPDSFSLRFEVGSGRMGCPIVAPLIMYHPESGHILTIHVEPILVQSHSGLLVARKHGPWAESLHFQVEVGYRGTGMVDGVRTVVDLQQRRAGASDRKRPRGSVSNMTCAEEGKKKANTRNDDNDDDDGDGDDVV